mgnify:CR=1 FL=1
MRAFTQWFGEIFADLADASIPKNNQPQQATEFPMIQTIRQSVYFASLMSGRCNEPWMFFKTLRTGLRIYTR